MIEFVDNLPASVDEMIWAKADDILFDLKKNPNTWAKLNFTYLDDNVLYYRVQKLLGVKNMETRNRVLYGRYFEYPTVGTENVKCSRKSFWKSSKEK